MLFHITHTHTNETCPAVHPKCRDLLKDCWLALKTAPEVKVLEAYAAPLDHVFHFTLDAADLTAVVHALAPLNAIGAAQTIPVMPLDDLLDLVDPTR